MTLRVLDPGLFSLVVDFGRPSYRSLGVPAGGAADQAALVLGNALVGNPPNTPALELSLVGPTLQADCSVAAVVYGAPFPLASDRQRLSPGTTFVLAPGEELRIGTPPVGMRAYLCIHGGLHARRVLGSASAWEPVVAGAELPCSTGKIAPRFIRAVLHSGGEPRTLRVLDGPQAEWICAHDFYPRTFLVSPSSNRMGLRLDHEPLARRLPGELVSEPVCPGSVQLTHDGRCIILGVDGQTIGGYPKIAQVISADLDKVGQSRPGDEISFVRVELAEAEALYRQKQAELADWVTRLRTTFEHEDR